jgi:hypothetical protein
MGFFSVLSEPEAASHFKNVHPLHAQRQTWPGCARLSRVMSNETVHTGSHGAWHIHCHIVFPVKYRKAIFDTEVTTIIMETAEAITEQYAREMETMGTDKNRVGQRAIGTP